MTNETEHKSNPESKGMEEWESELKEAALIIKEWIVSVRESRELYFEIPHKKFADLFTKVATQARLEATKEPCEWEEEFDQKFVDKMMDINGDLGYEEINDVNCVNEIRAFIRQLLLSARQEADQRVAEAVRLLEVARCPNQDCDNKGTIAVRVSTDDWEPEQCQWCYEKNQALAPLPAKIK